MIRNVIIVVLAVGLISLVLVAGLVVLGVAAVAFLGLFVWVKIKQMLRNKSNGNTNPNANRVIDAEFEIIDE